MKDNWKRMLLDAGAEFEDDRLAHFGNPEQELQVAVSGDVITDLSQLGLIAVFGPDAQAFLQNQTCNDVRLVSERQSQLGAFCSAKGRILATFRLFMRGEGYYLRLPREMIEPTLRHLRRYVLLSKVQLEDVSDGLMGIGLSGPRAEKILGEIFAEIPLSVDEARPAGELTVLRLPGPAPRFELIGGLDAIKDIWTKLSVHAAPVGVDAWRLLDILAGVPTVYPATIDAFVPQMVNLQALNGLSFRKGCYPGQEVVARAHYLGKLKRRMYLAHVDTASTPQPGDAIFAPDTEEGHTAGRVVDAHAAPDGGQALLMVVVMANADQGGLRLGGAEGPLLELKPLPYPIED